jgi:hypothetical protein
MARSVPKRLRPESADTDHVVSFPGVPSSFLLAENGPAIWFSRHIIHRNEKFQNNKRKRGEKSRRQKEKSPQTRG